MTARPYTPETLANRWGCTSKTIRAMIHRGELQAFRLGSKLVRIPAEEVERVEACQNTGSELTVENMLSSGPTPQEIGNAIRSARLTVVRQKPSSHALSQTSSADQPQKPAQ